MPNPSGLRSTVDISFIFINIRAWPRRFARRVLGDVILELAKESYWKYRTYGGQGRSWTADASLFSATLCCSLNNLSDFRWPPKYLRRCERHTNRGLKSWVQKGAAPKSRQNLRWTLTRGFGTHLRHECNRFKNAPRLGLGNSGLWDSWETANSTTLRRRWQCENPAKKDMCSSRVPLIYLSNRKL